MRRIAKAAEVPEALRVYDPLRWCQDAIDNDDSFIPPRLRGCTAAELLEDEYARRILAPARYRQALWDSVGQRRGDHWYYTVLGVQRSTITGVWPDL